MSFGEYFVRSHGLIFGVVFLVLQIALAALIVRLGLALRRRRTIPAGLLREIEADSQQGDFSRLLARSQAESSFLAQVIAAALGRRSEGRSEARAAAACTTCDLVARLRQPLGYLALVGILSPLLGLLGTAFGMVLALMTAGQVQGTVNPAMLADAVGHSLTVTLHGLLLSVLALSFYFVFRSRLERVRASAGRIVDQVLTRACPVTREVA